MVGEQQSQAEKAPERRPPPRMSVFIRALRAFKRQYHRQTRRNEEGEAGHQRTMAVWTRRVGIFTIVIAVVSAVSTVIFFFQLSAMKGQLGEMRLSSKQTDQTIAAFGRLAKAAEETADATHNQTQIAADSAQRHLRAYVSVEPVFLKYNSALSLSAVFEVRNTGLTPAGGIIIRSGLQVKKLPVEEMDVDAIAKDAETPQPIVFPGQPFTIFEADDFTPDEMVKLRSPQYGLLACVVVEYKDVFERDRRTGLCTLAKGDEINRNFPKQGGDVLAKVHWFHGWNTAN
jgi:hypothetical protein